jgi:hypothetical protein
LPEYNEADAIVVFVNNEFKPENELSEMIIRLAGPEVQEELDSIMIENDDNIPEGQVYATSSGNLQNFKCIMFAVVSFASDDDSLENNDEVLNNCIFNALSECDFRETENLTRVAFSILDPFNSILQIDFLTNLALNSIISYFSKCCSRIESICLVESQQSIEPYIQGLTEKSKMPNSSLHLRPNNLYSQFKPKSEVKALQPTIKREDNDIIKLIYGSICDETIMADVLVNSTNEHLDLKNGLLSNMLLKLGGQVIQDEL